MSDLWVRVLQLENDGTRDAVRAFSAAPIPVGCIEDGRIIDKQKVAEAIKKAVAQAGPKKINTKKVVCSLPESKVFLRVISVPKMEKEEIGEAIKWEIEASIPLSVDQVYYDWQLIGESSGKLNILTIAVSREIIDGILEVFELAGAEVYVLESESVAMVRSLICETCDKKKEISLIVDLGSKRTNFIVAEDNVPFFTSSISFSSNGVTDTIAKTMGINNEDAEKIKTSEGINYCSEEMCIFNSVKSYLEGLAIEIEKTIDFYQNTNVESGKVEKIVICGGGANLKGLIPYLTKRMDCRIFMGDPWMNLDFGDKLPVINKEISLQFASAVGLAMRKENYENRN